MDMLENRTTKSLSVLLPMALGIVLLGSNLYGEIYGMRVAEAIPADELRFENDLEIGPTEALKALQRNENETDRDYAKRATTVIQRSMAHVRRWHGHPPDLWNQRIPFTENPYLHLLGHLPGLPQFERYHFANYKRSIERGIGVCGDHTLILSQVLDLAGIDNVLLSFRGHVLAEVRFHDSNTMLLDPDFGVIIHSDAEGFKEDPSILTNAYLKAGYSQREIDTLQSTFALGYKQFDSAYSFMRMRWWFEHVSYIAKWAVPMLLLSSAPILLGMRRRQRSRKNIQISDSLRAAP